MAQNIIPIPAPVVRHRPQPIDIVIQPDPTSSALPWTIIEASGLIYQGRTIRIRLVNTHERFTTVLGPVVEIHREYLLYRLRNTCRGWPHHLKVIRWFPEPPPPLILPPRVNRQLSGPGVPGDTN